MWRCIGDPLSVAAAQAASSVYAVCLPERGEV
jgi:hypothetical protein